MSTIAVVEDEVPIRDLLAVILRRAGYRVVTAADGLAALEMIARERPDVALIDVMMPGLDGPEVALRLRADLETAQIPIVLISAGLISPLPPGIVAFVRKPFDVQPLLDLLVSILTPKPGSTATPPSDT